MSKLIEALINTPITAPIEFPPVGDFHGANTAAIEGFEKIKKIYLDDLAEGHAKNYSKYRKGGKIDGLGMCYGGTEFMVKKNHPEMSDAEAKAVITNFFKGLPVFASHLKKKIKEAEKDLHIKTFIGRHISVSGLDSDKWFIRNEAKNGVYNYPIQGGGGELIRLILIAVAEWLEPNRIYRSQGNLICDDFATRIVTVTELSDELINELEACKSGNVRVLHVDGEGNVLAEFDRPLKLPMHLVALYDMSVYF